MQSPKISYLHVPACYNPKVFEMDDDIVLQYEITGDFMNADGKPKHTLD